MTIHLSFLAAVTLAGIAYVVGHLVVRKFAVLERNHIPEPVIGGLLFALALVLLRQGGLSVEFPTSGRSLDVLVGLLTTTMGLHVTPETFREGWRLFLVFLGWAMLLFLLQFLAALPFAFLTDTPLHTAIVAAPLSLVGVPYNLNPPSQIAPIEHLFQESYPDLLETARGVMMIGVLLGVFLAGIVGRRLLRRAGAQPPRPAKDVTEMKESVAAAGHEWMLLVTLILTLIVLAFFAQDLLMRWFPGFKPDYLPVVLVAYLFGGFFRLGFDRVMGTERFPKRSLNALLLGPVMGLVFGYALMSLPLQHLSRITLPLALGAVVGVVCSVLASWLLFGVLARMTDRYYASVIATGFLAVTTAWGPVGMGYLRFFMRDEGPVEPMPVTLPMNAFFLFPWLSVFMTTMLLRLFG